MVSMWIDTRCVIELRRGWKCHGGNHSIRSPKRIVPNQSRGSSVTEYAKANVCPVTYSKSAFSLIHNAYKPRNQIQGDNKIAGSLARTYHETRIELMQEL